jgi:hypothetical protein
MLPTESAIHRVNIEPTNGQCSCRITPSHGYLATRICRSSSISKVTPAPRFPDLEVSLDATFLLIGGREETDGAPSSLK